jgi:hypothetical protein
MIKPYLMVDKHDTGNVEAAMFSDRHADQTVFDVSFQRRGGRRRLGGVAELIGGTWWVTCIGREAIAPYRAGTQQAAAEWLQRPPKVAILRSLAEPIAA